MAEINLINNICKSHVRNLFLCMFVITKYCMSYQCNLKKIILNALLIAVSTLPITFG